MSENLIVLMYQVFGHQSIVPYAFTQQHPENCKWSERGQLENDILAVYRSVG